MNQEKIGKLIVELRREKNLTQEQLAEKIGVTDKSISRWENGKTMPDISMLSILASELDCTIQELLNGRKMTKEELLDLRETINNLVEYESDRQVKNDRKFNKYNTISFITLTMV
ncbi:MAG: helix-turn-helix domain-containing protein, partial [Bacilli bacterium]|nr:helix-turn-helix domain-containing protein [Bacilli bacterium]